MADLNGRAQALCEPLFKACDIRIRFARFDRIRLVTEPLTNQCLGLAHSEATCDNMTRPLLLTILVQAEQCACVPHLQVAVGELGGTPSPKGTELNATVTTESRLTTPEQFGTFIKDEVETWATVDKASGAKVE